MTMCSLPFQQFSLKSSFDFSQFTVTSDIQGQSHQVAYIRDRDIYSLTKPAKQDG